MADREDRYLLEGKVQVDDAYRVASRTEPLLAKLRLRDIRLHALPKARPIGQFS